LPGKDFYHFGKSTARKLLSRGIVSPKLFLNPVSIVRYFEYDFAVKNLSLIEKVKNVLDISSPYLFGFYCCNKLNLNYTYLNPDLNDLTLVKKYSSKVIPHRNYKAETGDATKLDFPNNYFDSVISISVIEHINNDGDAAAIKEMWRVLKPSGVLILTFPVSKFFNIEYSESDTYGLNVDQIDEKYFFQRVYDEKSIKERLLNNIQDFTILEQQIFGETEQGFYNKYSERWKKKRLLETVKDPYYISKFFKYLNTFDEIKESAVIGLTLRKNK
jgi:ubiquinone/menaquinone biosynthesis C-methylase UbiE